jgi:hypothetical protein
MLAPSMLSTALSSLQHLDLSTELSAVLRVAAI